MCCDFFILRWRKIQLSNLYRTHDTSYWYWHGFNPRVLPAWLAGWVPTVGGLIVTVRGTADAPRPLYQLYYMAFFFGKPHARSLEFCKFARLTLHTGFFTSALLFYITMRIFPVDGMGAYDDVDYYAAFTAKEAQKLGVMQLDQSNTSLEGVEHIEPLQVQEKGQRTGYIVADGVY